jgi:geranylgeranylglycerol-phosphate geranylgeranyltransferase
MRAIFDLFRFSLGFLSSFGVLTAAFIVYVFKGNSPDFFSFFFDNGVLESFGLVMGIFATMLLTWGVQAINDYFDVETDIANERFDRPLARGDISRTFALRLTSGVFISAIIIISLIVVVYQVTIALLLFTLLFVVIGIGYNLGVKQLGFVGNVWVSTGYVAPLFMGFFMMNPQDPFTLQASFIILITTFVLSVGREIIKDIQDYEGDKEVHLNSLAVKYGPVKAGIVAMAFFLITIVTAGLAGLMYQNLIFWGFYVIFSFTLILTIYTILKEKSKGGKKARKYTRWSMWIALSAFFFGIFFIP